MGTQIQGENTNLFANLERTTSKSHIEDFVFKFYLENKDFKTIQNKLYKELERSIGNGHLHSYSIAFVEKSNLQNKHFSIYINGPVDNSRTSRWSENFSIFEEELIQKIGLLRDEKINNIFQSTLF
jgi:hypothetical protein